MRDYGTIRRMGTEEARMLHGERQAARLLGISVYLLRAERKQGTGPPYHVVRGRFLYAVEDLSAWLSARRVATQQTA